MSVEHQPQPSDTHERSTQTELANLAREQARRPEVSAEAAAQHAELRAKEAREIIQKHEKPENAAHTPEQQPPVPAAEQQPPAAAAEQAPAPKPFTPHLDRTLNYRHTLASLQHKLTPAARNFSQVIHTPVVERTSEALEQTVMRPSVIAGATWTAAIVGLIFYVTADIYGFQLSGSEMLLALLGGAVLGLILEGITRLLRRRSR